MCNVYLQVFTEELSPYWEDNKAVAEKVGGVQHATNGAACFEQYS